MSRASRQGKPQSSASGLGFLRSFFRDYRTVGAVAATSRGVAHRMVELADVQNCERVAEFGSGTGAITFDILESLPTDGTLWAFEIHEPFAEYLRTEINDERIRVIEESAENIVTLQKDAAIESFDAIISTIPFSFLEPGHTRTIIRSAIAALKPDGVFVALQYHPRYLPPFLHEAFTDVSRELFLRNLPPATLLTARNPRS